MRRLLAVVLLVAAAGGGCREATRGDAPIGRVAPEARAAPGVRAVRDARGVEVRIPRHVRRVATVSDGLVEAVLLAVKAPVDVVAVGSTCLTRTFRYTFETRDGQRYAYDGGQTPAVTLWPALREVPIVVRPGTEINLEQLARAAPDVLVIHAGCCTVNWRRDDRARMGPTLARLTALGIPTVVLGGPHWSGTPSEAALAEAIRTIGEVVGRPLEADRLVRTLGDEVEWIRRRVGHPPEPARPRVLLFGLSPAVRRQGGAGTVAGRRSIESWLLEEVAGARNAFPRMVYTREVNAEHVLALDPDAVLLPTAGGFHPVREILEGPAFVKLRHLRALQDRRVASLPWTPCNCDKRLEYPLDALVMAKLAWPDRFQDVDVTARAEALVGRVYGVDPETARRVRRALWIEDGTREGARGSEPAVESASTRGAGER